MTHFDAPTAEALKNIKELDNTLNTYAKLAPGESKEWYFDPNTIEEVPNKFNPNQNRIRFKVYDPDLDAEFLWDVSQGAARRVVEQMKQNNFFLKVQRQGQGTETRYQVTPITTDKGGVEFPS